jgi:hypothetical protein
MVTKKATSTPTIPTVKPSVASISCTIKLDNMMTESETMYTIIRVIMNPFLQAFAYSSIIGFFERICGISAYFWQCYEIVTKGFLR